MESGSSGIPIPALAVPLTRRRRHSADPTPKKEDRHSFFVWFQSLHQRKSKFGLSPYQNLVPQCSLPLRIRPLLVSRVIHNPLVHNPLAHALVADNQHLLCMALWELYADPVTENPPLEIRPSVRNYLFPTIIRYPVKLKIHQPLTLFSYSHTDFSSQFSSHNTFQDASQKQQTHNNRL